MSHYLVTVLRGDTRRGADSSRPETPESWPHRFKRGSVELLEDASPTWLAYRYTVTP